MDWRSLARGGLIGAGLLAGLWLGGSNLALAQDTSGGPPLVPSLPTDVPAPAELPLAGASGRKPPLMPIPRTGMFLIPPTGQGYYSFRDWLEGNYREKPPKFPWPPVSPFIGSFFDADFRYLDDPKNTQFDWLDPVKRIHPTDHWLLSIGGEERFQYKNEVDSRLSGKGNVYELLRSRVYGDLWYQDLFRVYVEYIDARTWNQDLPPLPIDQNQSDLLNLFADLKLYEVKDKPIYFRIGRQELLYGSERLISPLDWANTRRTFEGIKGFWHGDKLDIDAFWVKPVVVSPSHFDAADANRGFAGLWTTYRPRKGQAIDLYYLYLDQHFQLVPVVPPAGRGGQVVNTFGARYAGDYHHVLWDAEGMFQFGKITDQSISAAAVTTGLGYHFADVPMNPIFWVYNDFASGDDSGGRGGTFNQLFPFGHFYFGFIDAVGRQNIEDLSMQLSANPTKWITTFVQGHFFYLDSGKDALYNAAAAPTRKDPKGMSGLHVGDEIDFVVNFHLTTHQDLLFGYSKLFAGEFIRNTGNPRSPELVYLQYSFKW